MLEAVSRGDGCASDLIRFASFCPESGDVEGMGSGLLRGLEEVFGEAVLYTGTVKVSGTCAVEALKTE